MESYWLDAGRDLALLVVGSALTIFGGWLANLSAAKNARAQRAQDLIDASTAREREALENARQIVFTLYINARAQHEAGERSRIKFDDEVFLDAEARVYLVPDKEVREALTGAMGALRGLGAAVELGTLKGDPVRLQVKVLFAALHVLSALVRGDDVPATQMSHLIRVGNATRDAWQSLIASGQAAQL